jgi:dipeptidase
MPCLSVFVPFFFGTDALKNFQQPSSTSDSSLWWEAEKVHQWICKNYQTRKAEFWKQAKQLQNEFLSEEAKLIADNVDRKILEKFSFDCLRKVKQLYSEFIFSYLKE